MRFGTFVDFSEFVYLFLHYYFFFDEFFEGRNVHFPFRFLAQGDCNTQLYPVLMHDEDGVFTHFLFEHQINKRSYFGL